MIKNVKTVTALSKFNLPEPSSEPNQILKGKMKIIKTVNAGGIPRAVITVMSFKPSGDFGAITAAEKWCDGNGYSRGSMQRHEPIAIAKGKHLISKWRNLGVDVEGIDGWILPEPEFMEGGCRIEIFK